MWNDKWSVEGPESLGASETSNLGTLMAESMAATVAAAGISAAGILLVGATPRPLGRCRRCKARRR